MGEGGEGVTEFEEVYRTYFRDVELYLRAICHDEALAEELTEQVFFQTLKALPKFRGDCDIRTCRVRHEAVFFEQARQRNVTVGEGH